MKHSPAEITPVALYAVTAAFTAFLCLSHVAIAAPKSEAAATKITVVFKQLNVPVEASFKKVAAQVNYNASQPAASKAMVDIDVASFDLGDPDYNKEVLRKEWFNAAQFPKATFVSSAIIPDAKGNLTVSGKLTIKGKSADVTFPLRVMQQAGNKVFDGALPIKRTQFNIGEGEWKDVSVVADEVVIKFHVVAP